MKVWYEGGFQRTFFMESSLRKFVSVDLIQITDHIFHRHRSEGVL